MNICILGATGSIGENTIRVCKNLGYNIVGLTCNTNYLKLAEIISFYNLENSVKFIGISDNFSMNQFKTLGLKMNYRIFGGNDANIDCIVSSQADTIVNALVGSEGIKPSFVSLSNCKRLALANKETIVAAGDIILNEAKKNNCEIVPIDSEHGAILQCLENNPIKKIYLTASGGPFWRLPSEQFDKITIEQALNHPNWKMGRKITIDSATMMNKGFEVIEASKLYSLSSDKIDVLIHPSSIVHSIVEYCDNSMKAQLSTCDMKIHIQYALTYPKRVLSSYEQLDLTKYPLEFFKTDIEKFKCLKLAYMAVEEGGTIGTVINAVNDVCVESFLNGRIKFTDIGSIIERVTGEYDNIQAKNIDHILEIDSYAKTKAKILEENI